jgi:hypothetical protein
MDVWPPTRTHARTDMRGEARDRDYVSRLQCVQAAINMQITEMHKSKPNTRCAGDLFNLGVCCSFFFFFFRVVLVTFSNEVLLYGDGMIGDKNTTIHNNVHTFNERNINRVRLEGSDYDCRHAVEREGRAVGIALLFLDVSSRFGYFAFRFIFDSRRKAPPSKLPNCK